MDPIMQDRILRNVTFEPNTGCWIWLGATSAKGYGRIKVDGGRRLHANRASYVAFNGQIPDRLFVLHRCDVPNCVNPGHLFVGTAGDNMQDCLSKGRRRLGQSHPNSTLTDDVVREIRASRETSYSIAKRLGLGRSHVEKIRARVLWRHVK